MTLLGTCPAQDTKVLTDESQITNISTDLGGPQEEGELVDLPRAQGQAASGQVPIHSFLLLFPA